ncbi:TetR/AcrR family transcriptional regulator C-terminal domain-containing protein [Micromonospora sp. NPDC049559]|uniref:TetR/AcrR family transcriptional regulator n=1 Tax=Micromonospora sp. NPDC049559 TaxID=3155923 RepID=UPI0034269DF5
MCGRQLPAAGRGRPARYCSRACRARAYRERVAERQREETPPPTLQTARAVPPGERLDPAGPALTLERVVRAAITLADRDGSAGLSMRRTAAELGVGAMSLYRYVPGKEELGGLMIDAVFGDRPLPEPGPPGWRAKLELSAWREWETYVEHPWVPHLFALTTRPPIARQLMAYTDWRIRAFDDTGLDFATKVRIAIAVSVHAQSAAFLLAHERQARGTREQWVDARSSRIQEALGAGGLPMIAQFDADALRASEPASVFEFGLHRLLDGVAQLVPAPPAGAGGAPEREARREGDATGPVL